MEEKTERNKLRLHLCMAFIGGCFGAYALLQFSHFASAVTVNFIEVFTGAAQGNWTKSLLRLGAVVMYAVTLFLAAYLPGRVSSDLRLWAVLLDMAASVAACLVPASAKEAGVYILIFAMGFQWAIFAGKQGYPCATIFSTNNLRQFVDAWVQVHCNGDASQAPRMRLYGRTLLSFHLGVLTVCVLWLLGCGRWSSLSVLPAGALALHWLRRETAEKL